ncbi:hypothetical protein [Vitiosangium sp. GDMCC 1.1324]|uniref:hypothetical protein n=1 Tax=Vitiosangium sp. (strain GDMCC 1.1324) TaxID=2138576 RepID=UPI000D3CAD12|nr:hypothetical protein [Vitiosangium sp. GDMCC 1.1324]PTL82557.1 hypothetical protein DAT35_17300 [Vitiosangium sp. GDMCC 1.1324]
MTFRKSLLISALMLVGCGRMSREDEFRAVLPTQEMVAVKTPEKSGQALMAEGTGAQSGQNQLSDLYVLTRVTTVVVNGGTLAVLGLVDAVTKYPPTSVTNDTAVWGPHTEALARNTWKLTVKKTGDHTYSYALSAKAKDAADSAFVDIVTGTHTASLDAAGEPMKGFGQGEFKLDWDKAATLPEHDNNVGSFSVKYSRLDDKSTATVDASFRQIKDDKDSSKRVDADYRYAATPGQGGQFDYKLNQDWYKPEGSSSAAPETLTIKSRWQETGAGRSDVKLAGGDLGTEEATASECWNASFASVYLRASYTFPQVRYGTENTDCAFTPAVYSSL